MHEDNNEHRNNMHIESWHRKIKYDYFKGNRNKRVDKLLKTLLEMDEDTKYVRTISNTKGKMCSKNRKINERHKVAQNAKLSYIGNLKIQVILLKICMITFKINS